VITVPDDLTAEEREILHHIAEMRGARPRLPPRPGSLAPRRLGSLPRPPTGRGLAPLLLLRDSQEQGRRCPSRRQVQAGSGLPGGGQ
jgi:hypothetical protein